MRQEFRCCTRSCVVFYARIRPFSTRAARNPYEVLGVSHDASSDDIKKAFYALSKKYHPDVVGDEGTSGKARTTFLDVKEAYDQLRDETRRREVDQRLGGFGASYHGGRFVRRGPSFSYEGGFSQSENRYGGDRAGQPLRRQDGNGSRGATAGRFRDPTAELAREERDRRHFRLAVAGAVAFVVGVNVLFVWLIKPADRRVERRPIATATAPLSADVSGGFSPFTSPPLVVDQPPPASTVVVER